MSIDFPIDIPLEEYTNVTVTERNVTSSQASPYTGRIITQVFAGDYWEMTLSYTNLDRPLYQRLLGFISSLRTDVGTFKVRYPGYDVPLGSASSFPSSPLVDGANQAGSRQINVKAAPVSTDQWLLSGDMIQIGPANRANFHRVLKDVDTDAFGRTTLDIWPAVREGVLDNDAIEYNAPLGVFRLTREPPRLNIRAPNIISLTLQCREVN